jgi:hypothetical protein
MGLTDVEVQASRDKFGKNDKFTNNNTNGG